MKPDVMMVIDVQKALIDDHPYQESELLQNIGVLLSACREQRIPVIYVQHQEETGALVAGSDGWQIAAPIAPLPGEKTFDKKFNSAFRQTGLHEYLQQIGAHHLIICGMQTEYCVDTTVKVAFELGYDVDIPNGGTSTYDNKLFSAADLVKFYQWYIWHDRFAHVLSMEALLAEITE